MNTHLSSLKYPIKININFALQPNVEQVILAMNATIRGKGFKDIDFSPKSPHIPHITLLMGNVLDESAMQELLQRCHEVAISNPGIAYSLSSPYWMKPSERFLFVDTNPLEKFQVFKELLAKNLLGLIECEHYGGPQNPSHITIGYGDKKYIPLSEVSRGYRPIQSMANNIRVCEAGKRGTCHHIIHEFPMI